jgi:hypothetical protein
MSHCFGCAQPASDTLDEASLKKILQKRQFVSREILDTELS